MSRPSSFRQTIKVSALIFSVTALCFLFFGVYQVLQWSDSVRATYQAMATPRSSSAQQIQKSGSKGGQLTETNANQIPPSSSSSPTDSSQATNQSASNAPETTTITLPFYEELARTPLISTCALITRLLNARHVTRLKEDKARGLSENARHLKDLFRLTASAAYMDFMARLPHNYALMYSYGKDPGVLTKLEYAAEILLAKKELEQNIERIREIENRSYRTYFVATTLIDNPDFIGDSNFNAACESLADMSKPMSLDEANETVFQIFQRAQVNPAETKFDPNWTSQTAIKTNDEGYNYYGGENSILEALKRVRPASVSR